MAWLAPLPPPTVAGAGPEEGTKLPRLPEIRHCKRILTRFEEIQYIARPAGKLSVIKPRTRGNMIVIMRWVDCCCGSAVGGVVAFCTSHVLAPVTTGIRNAQPTGFAETIAPRSIPINAWFSGIDWSAKGKPLYNLSDKSTRLSGVSPRTLRIATNMANRIGI